MKNDLTLGFGGFCCCCLEQLVFKDLFLSGNSRVFYTNWGKKKEIFQRDKGRRNFSMA